MGRAANMACVSIKNISSSDKTHQILLSCAKSDDSDMPTEGSRKGLCLGIICEMGFPILVVASHPSTSEAQCLFTDQCGHRKTRLYGVVLWEGKRASIYLLSDHFRIVTRLDFERAVIGP